MNGGKATRSGKWTGNPAAASCCAAICSRSWADLTSSSSISLRKWICAGGYGMPVFGSGLRQKSRSPTSADNRSAVFRCGLRLRFAETDIAISTSIMEAKGRSDIAASCSQVADPTGGIRTAESDPTQRSGETPPGNVSRDVYAGTNNSIRSSLCNTEPNSRWNRSRCKRR